MVFFPTPSMPSLRKRVSSYFRQLSFHNEPREKRHNINENSFITKYLQGDSKLRNGPPIVHGKNPTDLPNYDLCPYRIGPESIVGCYTGPSGGCTTIQRQEKHLSMGESEIEFIDNPDNEEENLDQRYTISSTISNSPQQSPAKRNSTTNSSHMGTPSHRNSTTLDITSMQIRVAGQTYLVTSNKKLKFEETQINLQKSLSQSSLTTLSANLNEPLPTNTQKSSEKSILANPNYNVSAYATLPRVGSKQQIQGSVLNAELKDDNGNTKEGSTLASVAALGDLTSIQGLDKETEKMDETTSIRSGVLKSKSAGNPFRHTIAGAQPKKRKEGKIIRIANRPTADNDTLIHMTDDDATSTTHSVPTQQPHETLTKLPPQWRKSSEYAFGIAHSLYDRNPITGKQNGDPIADCFGLISRKDSAVLAVADGVNWGEKACIAAKSAIHASLQYLNTTLFHDSTLFTIPNTTCPPTNLTYQTSQFSVTHQTTKDVFIALLRAFNCAHDLILERGGMLTTLTVAVVLPVKGRSAIGSSITSECDIEDETDDYATRKDSDFRLGSLGGELNQSEGDRLQQRYVCCVCNVGDTLAYVYSQRDGIRELTKGSHDVNCNRDMRDALGALGPVDGHNPELSNLTLSITTVQRGDIILVASDGLTDNFDPNVCKFTVSANTNSVATNTSASICSMKRKDSNSQSTTRKQSTSINTSTRDPPTTTSSNKDVNSLSNVQVKATSSTLKESAVVLQVPIKPPRKTKNYIAMNRESVNSRSSTERTSITSSQRSGSKTSLSMSDEVVQSNPLVAQFLSDNSIQPRQQDTVANLRDKDIKSQIKIQQAPANTSKTSGNKHVIPVQKSISMKNVPFNHGKSSKSAISGKLPVSTQNPSSSSMVAGFSFLRSKTLVDFRPQTSNIVASTSSKLQIVRNNDGVPYVTPLQRYELTLLLMEDILKRGITGREEQCVTARKLCQELYNFTISLTNAKRKTLEEDSDLYYNQQQTNATASSTATTAMGNAGTGVLIELGALERKARRKRALERVQALPGKLDHVTVVAYNVGMW